MINTKYNMEYVEWHLEVLYKGLKRGRVFENDMKDVEMIECEWNKLIA